MTKESIGGLQPSTDKNQMQETFQAGRNDNLGFFLDLLFRTDLENFVLQVQRREFEE